jgi:hypothetical protein
LGSAEASVLIARVEAGGISKLDVRRRYFLRHRVEVWATGQQPGDHGKWTEAAEFRPDLQIILLRLRGSPNFADGVWVRRQFWLEAGLPRFDL